MTPVQAIKIMRAADTYATVAVRVHNAKQKARLVGDSVRAIDKQRDAARNKLMSLLQEFSKSTEGV